jgi:hypothetical protein
MEDEQQSTLKKKISILFQLGKWLDVLKLSESYAEKYGKDMEVDLIRFKSERHLGISVPPQATPPLETEKAAIIENNQPLVLDAEDSVIDNPIVSPLSPPENKLDPDELKISRIAADEIAVGWEDKLAYDPAADESEMVIEDPFADDEPGFSLAPDEPPVILSDLGNADIAESSGGPVPEIVAAIENAAEPGPGEIELDFSNMAAMTIDADPQLTPDVPKTEKPETDFRVKEEAFWEEPARSASGGGAVLEESEEEIGVPAAPAAADEKPQGASILFQDFLEKKAPTRKKIFNFKLALLIILPLAAAVVLWLGLSGKLNFSGGEAQTVNPVPVAKPVLPKRLPLVKKIPPPAPDSEAVEKDKAFDEKFLQASGLFKKGDILKAWALVLEAKKIKMTEPLRLLEEQLAAKIQADEARAKQESQVVQSQWQQESQAYAKAEAENTMAGWQNFLKTNPQRELAFKAEQKIAVLEKKVQENSDQQLLLRIQQLQKIKLRGAYLSLSQADIAAMLRQSGKPPAQSEAHEHGGVKVMLDYATGLMWTLWNKPMAYDKAKWWANRVTAGYGGWRLPTAEEAVSLLQMDRTQYSGLADFAVWTGDTVSDQPRTVWTLKLPAGQFAAAAYNQIFYVWAVRKAGK